MWVIKNIVNEYTALNAKKLDVDPDRVPLAGKFLARGKVMRLPDSSYSQFRRFIDLLRKHRILKTTRLPDVQADQRSH
jgi:hypothetical protein